MNSVPPAGGVAGKRRPESFHQWRRRKDLAARWLIALGGVGVILAVVLIFFYLLYVVSPLLKPASAELSDITSRPSWEQSDTKFLAVEEQLHQAVRIGADGMVEFVSLESGENVKSSALPLPDGVSVVSSASAGDGLVALTLSDGRVLLIRMNTKCDMTGASRIVASYRPSAFHMERNRAVLGPPRSMGSRFPIPPRNSYWPHFPMSVCMSNGATSRKIS